MTKLKLGTIPDDKPVKLTIQLAASVHRDLVAYAQALGRETGGGPLEPAKLIGPMLACVFASIVITASNSLAKACAAPEQSNRGKLDQPPSPMTQIHRPARLATRAESFRRGGRHHPGIPGGIIPLCLGDFVGIRTVVLQHSRHCNPTEDVCA